MKWNNSFVHWNLFSIIFNHVQLSTCIITVLSWCHCCCFIFLATLFRFFLIFRTNVFVVNTFDSNSSKYNNTIACLLFTTMWKNERGRVEQKAASKLSIIVCICLSKSIFFTSVYSFGLLLRYFLRFCVLCCCCCSWFYLSIIFHCFIFFLYLCSFRFTFAHNLWCKIYILVHIAILVELNMSCDVCVLVLIPHLLFGGTNVKVMYWK